MVGAIENQLFATDVIHVPRQRGQVLSDSKMDHLKAGSQVEISTQFKSEVEKAVQVMNDKLLTIPHTQVKFELHDELNKYYVTVVDEITQEVIREIPPKKLLDMFASMISSLGLLVDKQV